MNNIKMQRYYVFKLFYSHLLKQGNKQKAFLRLRHIVDLLKKKDSKKKPFHLIFLAVNNLCPPLNFRTKKIAAQKIKIPTYITVMSSYKLGVRWLYEAANKGSLPSFEENIVQEVLNALENKGLAYKKKTDMCKDFADSRAYVRFMK
jgi:small subunit ribosomal protein S7